jgi:hypothetical protein
MYQIIVRSIHHQLKGVWVVVVRVVVNCKWVHLHARRECQFQKKLLHR